MKSQFAIARRHLEDAFDALSGADDASRTTRMTIEILIEGILKAEHTQPTGEIIPFPRRIHSNSL